MSKASKMRREMVIGESSRIMGAAIRARRECESKKGQGGSSKDINGEFGEVYALICQLCSVVKESGKV